MVAAAKEVKDSLRDRLYGSIILPSNMVEFYPDPTLVIDADSKVAAWNKAIEKMTGVKAEDMLGKGNYEYALPFYGKRKPILVDMLDWPEEKVKKNYKGVLFCGDKLEASTMHARLKGRNVVLWGTASKLLGMDGKPVGAIECIRDITAQKTMEEILHRQNSQLERGNERLKSQQAELSRVYEQLKESEEKYRLIMTSTSAGLIAVNVEGIITYINTTAREMIGLESDRIIGCYFTDFIAEEHRAVAKHRSLRDRRRQWTGRKDTRGDKRRRAEGLPGKISGSYREPARCERTKKGKGSPEKSP
jgi:PAS domain S-box-containing protein